MPAPRRVPTQSARPGDAWLTVNRTAFTVWDRWFLTLVHHDHQGDWRPAKETLRSRTRTAGFGRDDAEAKLSHLVDLECRWLTLDDGGRARVERECHDPRIRRRAHARIFERTTCDADKSPAMRNTPRRRLRSRALRGHWPRFPISPARYEAAFAPIVHARDFFGERASFGLARRLESRLERESARAGGPAARTAVLRAFLTVMIAVFDRADDSCGRLTDCARSAFPEYFRSPWQDAGLTPDLYYRDFLEYAIWEDYGLLYEQTDPFFRAIRRPDVTLVDALLRELRQELQDAGLDYQAEATSALLGELYAVKRVFDRFEELAAELGSEQWRPIVRLAEAAAATGRRDLAAGVFAAADRPGMHRDYLRTRRQEVLGALAPARSTMSARHLRLVRRPRV